MCEENPPVEYISQLVESVLGVLEDAGVPTDVNDKVVALIEQWEHSEWLKTLPHYGQQSHPEGYDQLCACDDCLSSVW